MAPNVSVPMNFGIRLLDSPTHSTLELKASQGAVIPASSVILSFNSPVIDHMTTTLHLTSVDMEEFSEDAVRYFVDAAYSGESPPISRVLFRDINKLANVFEMSWLATRCIEQFDNIAAAIREPSYEDFFFLFDEAEFVLSKLKSREMVEIALTKILSLNGQEDFISRYLVNISSLTCQQLDLIIEIAGTKVEFVVKPLTEQLTAILSEGRKEVPVNCKYLLDNCELQFCQLNHASLHEQLLDVLQGLAAQSFDEFRWVHQLLRNSSKKALQYTSCPRTTAATLGISSETSVIPNLFHSLDCSLTFEEVVDWLGASERVINLMMFFEGLWMWMWTNKKYNVVCSDLLLQKMHDIKDKREWDVINQHWLRLKMCDNEDGRFFRKIKSDRRLCSSAYDQKKWISTGGEEKFKHINSIFNEETKLTFCIDQQHPAVQNCSKSGKCGVILKTVPAKDGATMILCTDSCDYSKEIHYHEEFQAIDMHVIVLTTAPVFSFFPLSWNGIPVVRNNNVQWGEMSTEFDQGSYTFHLRVNLRN